MKRFLAVGVTSAISFLLFGAVTPVYAQKDQHEQEAKPAQEHQQQAKPAPQQQRAERQQQQAKPAQEQQRAERPQQQAKPAQQQQRAERPQQQTKPAQELQRTEHQQQQTKPAQELQRTEHQQPQAKPAQQQQQRAQQQQPQGGYQVPQRTQQQARSWQQQRGWQQQGSWQEHSSWQQDRSSNWQSDHRTWEQRGGYGGYYIPEDRFGLYFGSQHWFRIHGRPTIVAGYPRFQQDGFWFMLVDPWPESWSENWYATDDVYVGYNDGYYLYNRRDPGVGIALTVVL